MAEPLVCVPRGASQLYEVNTHANSLHNESPQAPDWILIISKLPSVNLTTSFLCQALLWLDTTLVWRVEHLGVKQIRGIRWVTDTCLMWKINMSQHYWIKNTNGHILDKHELTDLFCCSCYVSDSCSPASLAFLNPNSGICWTFREVISLNVNMQIQASAQPDTNTLY